MVKTSAIVAALLTAFSAAAQQVTMGAMPPDVFSTGFAFDNGPVSVIDLAHTANGAGTITRASVQWSQACTGAFKIVFLANFVGNLNSYTVRAVRGPFDAVAGRNDVAISPAVQVSEGDRLAIVELKSFSTCGGLSLGSSQRVSGTFLTTNADIGASGVVGSQAYLDTTDGYGMIAYDSNPLLVSVVPGAGATQGNGAFFRTALQLQNLSSTASNFPGSPIDGQIVFHPAGQSASPSDPSLHFTLQPGQVTSYPDVITTMGTSGLGTLDVVTTGGTPVVSARVFSDGGAAGTSGFNEEGLPPDRAFAYFQRGTMIVPADLTNYRMNVGIRTVGGPVQVNIDTYGPSGTHLNQRTVTYSANYFEQVPVNTFAGITVPAGATIAVFVKSLMGSIFVYESITDNRTQDSALRMATGQ